MKPGSQDFFNQYRENTIIEVVQALARSEAGSQIVFKGGTALKMLIMILFPASPHMIFLE